MAQDSNSKNKYVSWAVFVWAIGLLTVAIGWSLVAQASMEKKVQESNVQFVQIQSQLSGIQADLVWIKKSIDK